MRERERARVIECVREKADRQARETRSRDKEADAQGHSKLMCSSCNMGGFCVARFLRARALARARARGCARARAVLRVDRVRVFEFPCARTCVSFCLCVCVCACQCVCACVCACVCGCVCLSVCLSLFLFFSLFVCVYLCVCAHVRVRVCVCLGVPRTTEPTPVTLQSRLFMLATSRTATDSNWYLFILGAQPEHPQRLIKLFSSCTLCCSMRWTRQCSTNSFHVEQNHTFYYYKCV